MFIFFTTAKPFVGNIKVSQYNSIKSWQALDICKEIILFGTGEGYEQAVNDLGIIWIPEVETSPQGTPTVNSMFRIAREFSIDSICVYLNCDIILLSDFPNAFPLIPFDDYLLVSQRYDLTISNYIDPTQEDCESNLRKLISEEGVLHPPSGSDIFAFSGWPWSDIPKLVIGRAGYDNELIFNSCYNSFPVIDATCIMSLIHQNHDYGHKKSGKADVWNGIEASINKAQLKKRNVCFTLKEASYYFYNNTLTRRSYKQSGMLHSLRVNRDLCKHSVCNFLLDILIFIFVFLQKCRRRLG